MARIFGFPKQRDEGLLSAQTAPQRGPAPRSSESKELEKLEREVAKLKKKLEQVSRKNDKFFQEFLQAMNNPLKSIQSFRN